MQPEIRNMFSRKHSWMQRKATLISFFFLTSILLQSNLTVAQDTLVYRKSKSVLDYSPYKNKYRIGGVSGIIGGAYIGSMVWLNSQWYAQYPRSKFQFFNDAGEWNQIDKCGHIQAAYVESYMSYHVFRWMGLNQMEAAGYSALASFLAMSSIEVLDGFSAKWGASWSDLGANAFGSLFAMGQNMAWGEQRMMLKMSMHLEPYPQGDLRNRANDLYGTNLVEKFLKDYNNMNFWLSINPAKFNPKQKHAKWLSIAVGYGAGNMYGGFENKWTDKNGIAYDYTHVKRYRKFFISMDYDLSQIKTKTRFGRVVLGALNWIKLPAPAIEFNTLGQVVFHPCYFLNMEMPIYFKK
jgi:hypothetical protein